jgi:hypothetical protein
MPNQSSGPLSGSGLYNGAGGLSSTVTSGNGNIAPGWLTSNANIVWTTAPTRIPAYVVLKLPIKRFPDLVFVGGIAVTMGLLGSKAECAFGLGCLIIGSKVIQDNIDYHSGLTLILQFKTKTYHYSADYDNSTGFVKLKSGTNIIDAEVLCQIKRM